MNKRGFFLLDVSRGQELHKVGEPTGYWNNGAAFAPDGKTVACAPCLCGDAFSVWDVATGKVKWQRDQGRQQASSIGLAFSPDGQVLATAGREWGDTTIRLWEVGTGKPFAELRGSRSLANRLFFTPDGQGLITGSDDSTVLIWDIRLQNLGTAVAKSRPDAAALTRAWAELAQSDATVAHQAMRLLLRYPDASLPFLRQHFPPVPVPSAVRIQALLTELDADKFEHREAAYRDLRKLHRIVEPQVRQALSKKPSLHMQRQLERLLEDMESKDLGIPPGDRLRARAPSGCWKPCRHRRPGSICASSRKVPSKPPRPRPPGPRWSD